jgi:acetyl esterase/lipase
MLALTEQERSMHKLMSMVIAVLAVLSWQDGWAQAPAPSTPAPAAAAQPPRAPTIVRKTEMYGWVQGSTLLADIAYPDGVARKPAIIYITGGRWRANSRIANNGNWERLNRWAADGYFTMSIDHRLVEATPAPAPYLDTLNAVRWLHAHAAEYGVDEDRIYMIGNSSGGHLVGLAAILGDHAAYPRTGGWENARTDIRAAIAVAAPYDVTTLSWGNLWTPLSGDVNEARRQASALHQISSRSKPLLIIHSDDDQSVPVQQAIDMDKALTAAGIPHRFVHYKDRGHMGLTEEILRDARAFIDDLERGALQKPTQSN